MTLAIDKKYEIYQNVTRNSTITGKLTITGKNAENYKFYQFYETVRMFKIRVPKILGN